MSQGARSVTLAWGVAWACVAVAASAASSLAQMTSPNTALPPLSGPPVDVPMHVPQPPRDVDATPPPAQAAPAPQAPTPLRPVPERSRPERPSPEVAAAQNRGGTITPIVPQCRETTYRVIIDGRPETAIARVCRMADGRWRLSP